eukprot:TRINITY_DN8833_c0_g2_i1.p1 TRINITY_DN8833_c0_g2~~TRINITY_DN8833_c0_g2_i1.p1  ORF type:complete len:386 (-),score=90.50 TRINITY_DN8833_c0_g2_i1:6-1163(-)
MTSPASNESLRTPTLSFESLRRARATVEDFARSYFPLHRVPVDAFLNFMDVLYFVEASLYESDERNEQEAERLGQLADASGGLPAAEQQLQQPQQQQQQPQQPQPQPQQQPQARRHSLEEAASKDGALRALVVFLRSRNLLDEAVQRELENGLEYWALERQLCAAPLQATVAQAQRALRLKSFDYRVLNLLLFQLRGAPYNAKMLAFMRQAELLVEIEDDLKDYNKDVVRNSFNIYRTYVRVHGSAAPRKIRSFIAGIERRYVALRSQALDAELLRLHIARNEEQCSAGPIMAPATGVWQLPAPVLDETRMRQLAIVTGRLPTLFVPGVGRETPASSFGQRLRRALSCKLRARLPLKGGRAGPRGSRARSVNANAGRKLGVKCVV